MRYFAMVALLIAVSSSADTISNTDPDRIEFVICYQLIDAFYELSAEQGVREMKQQIRRFHRDSGNANKNN